MEELLKERIFQNLTKEEKNVIIENRKIAEKIYLVGLIDGKLIKESTKN